MKCATFWLHIFIIFLYIDRLRIVKIGNNIYMTDIKRVKSAISEIQRILWENWDPIGLNKNREAYGEYDSYAGQIYMQLVEEVDDKKIAGHLYQLEVVNMGLNGHREEYLLEVVKKLREIDI